MEVAFGFKPHSGWAALVVIAKLNDEYEVLRRCRVELVEEEWAKQPYHAAEELKPAEAEALVKRGVDAAHRIALREMRAALKREHNEGNKVKGCAVLVGNTMPEWSVAQILAVHFRMHQAEGVLFREALVLAAKKCSVPVSTINEKQLMKESSALLKFSEDKLQKKIAAIGKSAGPPWAKDQKEATLGAMVALH